MFKLGTRYEFRMIEGADEVTFWGAVAEYNHPLLKLADTPPIAIEIQRADGGMDVTFLTEKTLPGRIINVASPNFVSAEEQTSD